jgi:hypothetical protein
MAKALRNAALGLAAIVTLLAPQKANAIQMIDGYNYNFVSGNDTAVVNPDTGSYDGINDLKLIKTNGIEYQAKNGGDTIKTRAKSSDSLGFCFYIGSISSGDAYASLVRKLTKAETPVTPKKEITLSTYGKDTVVDGHTYNLDNVNPYTQVTRIIVDGETKLDTLNNPTPYSNGIKYILNLAHDGGSITRARFAVSDFVNYLLGDKRKLYSKGVSDSVTFAAYDSTNKRVLLTTPTDTVAVKIGDTTTVDKIKTIVNAGSNGSINLTPIDTTASKIKEPNTFTTNDLTKSYVLSTNDTLNFSVKGDTLTITEKKNGGGTYTIKAKQGTSADLPNGDKLDIKEVFDNGTVSYVKVVYNPSTKVIPKIFSQQKITRNNFKEGSFYGINGRCVGNKNAIKNGFYIKQNPNGTYSKYLKVK